MLYAPVILCCGRDLSLLRTRQWIFQAAGFTTEITQEMSVVEQKLGEGKIDILVLCHSLVEADWNVARRAVRDDRCPPLLLFLKNHESKDQLLPSEISYNVWLNPAGLLDFVRELLLGRQSLLNKNPVEDVRPVQQKAPKKRTAVLPMNSELPSQ